MVGASSLGTFKVRVDGTEQLGDVSAHFREAGLDGLNSSMIMTVHVELILFNYRQL